MKYALQVVLVMWKKIISSLGIDALRINDGSESIDETIHLIYLYRWLWGCTN